MPKYDFIANEVIKTRFQRAPKIDMSTYTT